MPMKLWKDLSPLGHPLMEPSPRSPHVLVIGGGVTGLVTAWVLLDHGYRVTILSSKWANFESRITSQIAGALWEFPPSVCGHHAVGGSLAHSKRWSMTAYHIWDGIASVPDLSAASGVRMLPSDFFFPDAIETDDAQYAKMIEIMASGVRGFHRGTDIIERRGVDPAYGVVDAYELMAPVIDTDQALQWLDHLVRSKGAVLVTGSIDVDLLTVESSVRARYEADVLVNCTGLQGGILAGDTSVYPVRGGLIRVINDGSDFPKVEASLSVSADAAHDESEIIFLVPRNDNTLLIGGIAEAHEAELDLTCESRSIRRMRERCEAFLPCLKAARVDPTYALAQGLRPFRAQNVRVERELRKAGSRIVHSYGHGGSGWSLSFGCAEDVLMLVEEALADIQPKL